MQQRTPDHPPLDSDVEVILPVSRDWASLSTGGGVEAFLVMFIQEASEWGLHTTVLCPGRSETSIGSVRFVPIMAQARSELAFTRQLRRWLVQGKVLVPKNAVVLANTEHYAWAFRGIDVPIVLMSHGAIPATLKMRHNSLFVRAYRFFIERHAVERARRIIVVSPAVKEYYQSSYPTVSADRYVQVPLGLDVQALEGRPHGNPFERLSVPPSTDLVLFVGRLYPEKNPMLFVAACDLLKQQGERFHSLVVGDGVLADSLRTAMATRPWLHWRPVMAHSDVLDVMAVSKVLVICSGYESGPLVLLEAIGVGTPVVSTDVGRARELIDEGLGRIVNADPTALADGIRDVLGWDSEAVRKASMRVRHRIDFKDTMGLLNEIITGLASP